MDGEELHHAHDPCRVPDPDSHLSTFRHTESRADSRSCGAGPGHSDEPPDTRWGRPYRGGATAVAAQQYLIAAFTEEKGIGSRHVAFMLIFSACDTVLSINGAQ